MSEPDVLAPQQVEGQVDSAWKLESLTICECGPLYERIKQGLAEQAHVNLDLSQCEEVDTAGVQLLVAIQNDADVSLKIRWNTPSNAILGKANQLGLTAWVESGITEA